MKPVKWQMILGLMVVAGFAVPGQRAEAAEKIPTITIHVYNYARVNDKTLTEAEEVAADIYLRMGIEIEWTTHKQDSTAEKPADLVNIQLCILPTAMSGPFHVPNSVMGLAPGTGRDRNSVYIFYGHVEENVQAQIRTIAEKKLPSYPTIPQILGDAISHEMGHIFLNMDGHSETGIMRGNWNAKDFRDAACGILVFTPQQGQVIRSEVERRQTVEIARIEASNFAS